MDIIPLGQNHGFSYPIPFTTRLPINDKILHIFLHKRAGFIEKNDVGVRINGARDSDARHLTRRQQKIIGVLDRRQVAARKHLDVSEETGVTQRLHVLLLMEDAAKENVVADRTREAPKLDRGEEGEY